MYITARLTFELTYHEVTGQYFSHYTPANPDLKAFFKNLLLLNRELFLHISYYIGMMLFQIENRFGYGLKFYPKRHNSD